MRPETDALSAEELRKMHAYWRAANYLSVGQIYLFDNPLLKEPLARAHIKPRLLGHWGTTPGSTCTVRIVRTDEDLMIARHTRASLSGERR